MSAITGVDFIIKVNTGTVGAPVWTAVGGQRNATLNMATSEVDVTSKDSAGWHEGIPGIRSWSIEFDSLLLEGDAGLAALEAAYMNGEQVQVQMATPAGNTYDGIATLTDFSYEAPYEGEATATGTLNGSGALNKTAV
ncbi:MAG: phage major tail protein, TP901-1 family [Firmicutes bacterium]|nr:phage major tail protein, TP901-1 family [Bacillota bacterium]